MKKRICEICEDMGYHDFPAEYVLKDCDGGEVAVCAECYPGDQTLDGSGVVDVTVIE